MNEIDTIMLRRKKDSMRDIPKEVRHSLEVLDDLLDKFDSDQTTSLRSLKDVPTDVRKSLQVLDNVLETFEVDGKKDKISSELPDDTPEEVSKSLEVLDRVLNEFQIEGGKLTFRREKLLDKGESLRKQRNDDVRRSLEVLDSVLAEFDDCLEAWDSIGQEKEVDKTYKLHHYPDISLDNISTTSFSYDSRSIDGDTSHDSGFSMQEQSKIYSPPPIPKRSATTKLSDRSSGIFNFNQLEDNQSCDSFHSEYSTLDNDVSLSEIDVINTLSTKDDVFHCCTKCGVKIEQPSVVSQGMDMDKDVSSSPFSQKRKMFEDRANESAALDRQFNGSSFKFKSDRTKDSEVQHIAVVSCKSLDDGKYHSDHSKYSPKLTKVSTPKVDGLKSFSNSHAANCIKCKKRLEKLQLKFAETLRLLKANKIKGLDMKPPSFVPPPPPEVILENIRNNTGNSQSLQTNKLTNSRLNVSSEVPVTAQNTLDSNLHSNDSGIYLQNSLEYSEKNSKSNNNVDDHKNNWKNSSYDNDPKKILKNIDNDVDPVTSLKNIKFNEPENTSRNSNYMSQTGKTVQNGGSTSEDSKHTLSNGNYFNQNLCKRCSKSTEVLTLCETIEDIPKLLPTDALKRPHLGLSYSMEDDLSPGVKELLQPPSPRGGAPFTRKTKTTSLSTFSLSDTSLGYVSSQSDFEASNSPVTQDKVPVSALKYSTLPEGVTLKSLPSYYGHDESPCRDQKQEPPVYRDRNFNQTSDPTLKSSSPPLLPEQEKPPKKSIFRGFSRKNKDKKNKNGELKNAELVRGVTS